MHIEVKVKKKLLFTSEEKYIFDINHVANFQIHIKHTTCYIRDEFFFLLVST